jgi:hypothetical protein
VSGRHPDHARAHARVHDLAEVAAHRLQVSRSRHRGDERRGTGKRDENAAHLRVRVADAWEAHQP